MKKPSVGPVYRSRFAENGFPAPVSGMDSCWDIFRISVEKYPDNPMLGRRQIVDGKAGKYVWQTYKEVYDIGGKCGIYGANCAEWIMTMEACNAHGLSCVPLCWCCEFIICHAEVSIAFVEEKKIAELFKTFPNSTKYLRTIVSFGKVAPDQKEEAEKHGLAIFTWEEFLQLTASNISHEFRLKHLL
ncbi:hypothetical protein V6N12_029132 [Hibiscus sabdariffa]|uniref:Uncharacterized protein n=1 Tax=Hibiscus sabdariffa TaxID=183260 RepID=A0ABR1ZU46_9ROSI